jgi:multicomponent Na+:H+ antiporter subunit E
MVPAPLIALAQRFAAFGFAWWALAEGRGGWLAGTLAVGLATAASVALAGLRPSRLRPLAALRLLPWFLWRSLIAGLDVALRTLRTRPRIAPAFVSVRLRLADPAARVLLADAMCLLPGTLSAALEGEHLELHVLDRASPVERELRAMEERVAALLGLDL